MVFALAGALAWAFTGFGDEAVAGPAVLASPILLAAKANNDPVEGVRAAAIAWARAYLAGSVTDIRRIEGPRCVSDAPRSVQIAYLKQVRALLQHHLGRALKTIKIRDVRVQSIGAGRAIAQVDYAVPDSLAGNDNWVSFEQYGGKWKVADCRPPIGFSSSSSGGGSPAPPQVNPAS